MKSVTPPAAGASKSRKSSRRNQLSINHLLDFQSYEDLEEYHQNHRNNHNHNHNHNYNNNHNNHNNHSNNNRRRKFNSRDSSRSVTLRGFAYVNCHYKFIVDHRVDLTQQLMDPNIPVKVEDILCILSSKGNLCPICLTDEPVAPRMLTACGHTLCLTCLYSLLESEVPKAKKKQAESVVEKYRECPLCSSYIKLNEVVPVQITSVDDRFEVPKVGDDCVLSLMVRNQDRAWALPRSLENYYEIYPLFPMVSDNDGQIADTEMPDFQLYLRILLSGYDYIEKVLEQQKKDIEEQHKMEKELYNDDGVSTRLALNDINNSIAEWKRKFDTRIESRKHNVQNGSHSNSNNNNSSFYYFQTGFNASATFVLSPLDMKVLKTAYGSYGSLPSALIAKIENIRYEELNADLAHTKYKYLSHLPFGTTIGFLECNWYKNDYVDETTWALFNNDLSTRSKTTKNKLNREEKNRRRALNDEELKTKRFYETENGMTSLVTETAQLAVEDLPLLSQSDGDTSRRTLELEEVDMTTSVWGTKIPKAEPVFEEEYEVDWETENMIRLAKEESLKGGLKGKKKKKKIVLSLQ